MLLSVLLHKFYLGFRFSFVGDLFWYLFVFLLVLAGFWLLFFCFLFFLFSFYVVVEFLYLFLTFFNLEMIYF